MNKKFSVQHMEKKVKLINPIYAIGLVWLIYGLIFPLYRPSDFLIVVLLSAASYFLAAKFIPEKTIIVPLTRKGFIDAHCEAVIEAGMGYLDKLSKYHDKISDEAISAKLSDITSVSQQMFSYTAKNPGLTIELGMFVDYYYPTTLKLLEAYCDTHAGKGKSETAGEITGRISSVMNTIAAAFQKQLDKMYEDKALDVKTDIVVLKKILASEGLTDSDSEI